jgi:hypothetical protein
VVFFANNKKPAEAGFSKTIPTSCQKPSGPWSIILDPAAIPSLQLMDPIYGVCGARHRANLSTSCKPFAIPQGFPEQL